MRCGLRRPRAAIGLGGSACQALPSRRPPSQTVQETDRAGFEPAVPLTRYAGLANRCLQPLGHLSGCAHPLLGSLVRVSMSATR